MVAGGAVAGTPGEAAAISGGYRKEMEGWMKDLRGATAPERQQELWANKPDGAAHARRMKYDPPTASASVAESAITKPKMRARESGIWPCLSR